MSQNKLIDRNDSFGLIHSEPEPKTFFSVEQSSKDYDDNWAVNGLGDILTSAVVFYLADKSKTYEREVYTFMEMLGDFGGFNDGIMLFPAILMSIYSNKMFLQSLFSKLPVKSKKTSIGRDTMDEKCNGDQSSFSLAEADTELLDEESGRIEFKKNSWPLSLCFSKRLCKR